ncbi:MAG: cytochrome c biogenesis protein ResB [Chloroflexota bacterium]|nr:cytochrome c biogenesis protein ResB [Chloroflexota bacterium]
MASAQAADARRDPSFDLVQPVWRILTSVRFAVFFIATLAAFGLLGVLIPQVPEAMRGNNAAISTWLDGQRNNFGPLTDPIYRLGLFEVFHAKWFLVALGFLSVNVTVCVFNRWSPTFRNVFHPNTRVPDSFFDRAHNRTSLAPVEPAALEAALRRMRFRTKMEARDGATYIFADRYPWTQLATFISHLALILFISGGLVTRLTGFRADIFAGTGTTAPVFAVSNPNQLQVRIDDASGRFSDHGSPLDFRTQLTIFKNGREVASGTTTVNDPLKYGGYRFHQVAYFPNGAELKIRDVASGNTVFHETFPLEESTAAPAVTITDASGKVLLSDIVAPTDFLSIASGALVQVPNSGRIVWVGLTTTAGDKAWQLVAFDPKGTQQDGQLRIGEGTTGIISGLNVRFDRVASIPSAVGVDVPGGGAQQLAQLTSGRDGAPALMLVSQDRPAISLAPGAPTTVGNYEYTFVGQRAFAGISVKRDAGAWFIWAGTAMLLGGLAITFYLPRRRLWIRLTGGGTKIAALAEKSGGFERDMRALARRIGVPIPPELKEER